eukprot:4330890-Prymnesium_polylepis.1
MQRATSSAMDERSENRCSAKMCFGCETQPAAIRSCTNSRADASSTCIESWWSGALRVPPMKARKGSAARYSARSAGGA